MTHLIQTSLLGITLAMSALPVSSTDQATSPSAMAAEASSQRWSWMRGVPRGYRLVSLDIIHPPVGRWSRNAQADIEWQYATRDGQQAWLVLLPEVEILQCESLALSDEGPAAVRITVPLTPEQADRLREAAASGPLRVQIRGTASNSEKELPATTWRVRGIEDRTRAIELGLAKEAGSPEALERPTLAAPKRGVIGTYRGTITVPVEAK